MHFERICGQIVRVNSELRVPVDIHLHFKNKLISGGIYDPIKIRRSLICGLTN